MPGGKGRRAEADQVKTKPQIALEQIRWACESGLPRGVALMDAAYGRTRGCVQA